MKKVDMSEEAILRRLKTVDRLRELCLALMKAKKLSDEKMKTDLEKKEKAKVKSEDVFDNSFAD
ncbi:hypothetical protein BH20ACI4_BH20ACI4_16870 [soil metagenome]